MSELVAISGYSRKRVKKAIQTLLAKGVVCRDVPRLFALSGDWPYLVIKEAAESPGILAGEMTTNVGRNAFRHGQPSLLVEITDDPANLSSDDELTRDTET